MKIYVKINIGGSSREIIRKDDLIYKTLGESCHTGWHKFEANSEIIASIYKISAERDMHIGAYTSPVFSQKEFKSFTHFLPNFKALKMTDPQILKFLRSVRSFDLKDMGGIGKVALPENIALTSPVKINSSELKRITYHSDELIAAASFIVKLNDLGADLSDCTLVGNAAGGEDILLLRTKNFTSSVVMNETITDRLGFDDEANQIENRFYQSGSRCYEDLSKYGLMTRTIDSLSMQESPPWIINQTMVDFIKENSIWSRFDPVFQIGTPVCNEYLAEWREFMDRALLNPSNWVKFE